MLRLLDVIVSMRCVMRFGLLSVVCIVIMLFIDCVIMVVGWLMFVSI